MRLKLANPLKFMQINQSFGKNATDIYKKAGMPGHNGIDFYATHGTPIYASHDGWAQYQIGNDRGHGVVVISDKEYEHDYGTSLVKTVYWHMVDFTREPQYKSPIADKTGFVKVKTGDLLGFADNTGNSTGSHLHFELKPVHGSFGLWSNTLQSNGYFGAIDPMPYLPRIADVFTKIIKRGDENQEVVKLQAFFLRTGYMKPILRGFGFYGKATQEAVKQFQIDNGIKHNNGIQVGMQTLSALNNKYDL
jgi:hypothetical protein